MTHVVNIVLYTYRIYDLDVIEKFNVPKFHPICVGRTEDSCFVYGTYDINPGLDMTKAMDSNMVSFELLGVLNWFRSYLGYDNCDIQAEGIGKAGYVSVAKLWVGYIKKKNGVYGYFDYDNVCVKLVK